MTSSTPRAVHEFRCDETQVHITDYGIIGANDEGARVVWNHHGMRHLIPDMVITNARYAYEDYTKRRYTQDKIPPHVGLIVWEQTVRLPAGGSLGHASFRIEP
jgi:hypothetical protein